MPAKAVNSLCPCTETARSASFLVAGPDKVSWARSISITPLIGKLVQGPPNPAVAFRFRWRAEPNCRRALHKCFNFSNGTQPCGVECHDHPLRMTCPPTLQAHFSLESRPPLQAHVSLEEAMHYTSVKNQHRCGVSGYFSTNRSQTEFSIIN